MTTAGAKKRCLGQTLKAAILDSEKANRENRPGSRLLRNVLMLRVPISG